MKPSESNLLNLLSNHEVTFFIPPYQRNYEWSQDQCQVFFDDVVRTYETNAAGENTKHFFGFFTYFSNDAIFGQPASLVLIDGQQRITTTMLFLVALRDLADDDSLKLHIDKHYLKNEDVHGDGEYKVKLKQVETDWPAFRNIVLGARLTPQEKDTAVYRNYVFFRNKLKGYGESAHDLRLLVQLGLGKFTVVTLELQPRENAWENPQEIFESMNSLGKPLSLADLVRNYLLMGLDSDKQSVLYDRYWLKMERSVPGVVSDFIRDYMQARAACSFLKATDANCKKLYAEFKSLFAGRDAEGLLCDLERSSRIYSMIIGGACSGCADVDYVLRDLRTVNVSTSYSFLLALLEAWRDGRFTDEDVSQILKVFRIYCLRRRLVKATAAENKDFPLLANRIEELVAASDKKEKLFEVLSGLEYNLRLPNDGELHHQITSMNFYTFKYKTFFLSLIEEALTKCRPSTDDALLQIEHIMPQHLNEAWERELGPDFEDVHQELKDSIGNLTLIRHNQELGQRSFDEKRRIYEEHAGLQIARSHITDHDRWDGAAIRERAEWLAQYISENVLPIPTWARRADNHSSGRAYGALSFESLGLVGETIALYEDPTITARVVGDKEVEFEGERTKLSPLTAKIQERRGCLNESGTYRGAQCWAYRGVRLLDLMKEGVGGHNS